jgi:hypothetical protein
MKMGLLRPEESNSNGIEVARTPVEIGPPAIQEKSKGRNSDTKNAEGCHT